LAIEGLKVKERIGEEGQEGREGKEVEEGAEATRNRSFLILPDPS
jgi:hypothetical protein